MPPVATSIQNPGVVGVPTPSAQKAAIAICSAVRVSESCRISAVAAKNSADPNSGGAAGRNWLAEVRNQGVTPGSCPPAIVGGVVLLIQSPGPLGMVPVNGLLKPSPWARVTIWAPTLRPIASAAANPELGAERRKQTLRRFDRNRASGLGSHPVWRCRSFSLQR